MRYGGHPAKRTTCNVGIGVPRSSGCPDPRLLELVCILAKRGRGNGGRGWAVLGAASVVTMAKLVMPLPPSAFQTS
jgi:hypothetical protein